MSATKEYENYPLGTVVLSNTLSLALYGLGFFVINKLGLLFSLLYLLYVLILEYRLIKSCANCYYWGRVCGFGRGKISAWFFKKGEPAEFCIKKLTWLDLVPDMLVSLIPIVVGVVLMILRFDFLLLFSVLLILFLTTSGNGFIRGKLTCRYCKQKELGCPAYSLFNKAG
ncbi:MAG: hypothetical protein Q8907_10740 [Bacteroidota bacterium]|nr:hypothetical protein [Bacteroidota bacterium]MDP4274744.1 hypothetical protein [Bacteroidota bacterium]